MSKRPRILLVSVCAAFALLTATTVPAFDGQEAGLIPGGGPVRSDCYVELKVVGIDNPGPDVRSGRVVSCADGDPCDIDGECGNGSCPFGVAVCITQTDPTLPACHAPTGLQKLFVNPPKLDGAVPGSLDGPACGSFVAIPLPLKGGTQPAMVQVRLSANATAAQGTSPRRDRDTFVLKCLPRTTPCPTTSTTTTSPTTTTTSCPNTCLNGGTLNPDCSCTCPSGYESLNGGCFRIGPPCSAPCPVAASIDGSPNVLCVAVVGKPNCSSTSQC